MTPRWLHRLWQTATGRFGLIVVAVIALAALVSLFWTPFDPRASDIGDRWLPPGLPTCWAPTTPGATSSVC